jgi:hypothetical protein
MGTTIKLVEGMMNRMMMMNSGVVDEYVCKDEVFKNMVLRKIFEPKKMGGNKTVEKTI